MAGERADFLAAALDVLAQQYRGRPNFRGLLEVFARQFQELEDAAQQMMGERLLEPTGGATHGAIGEQLSVLERIVGQGVFLTADPVVRRAWIASRIKLNRSSGTGDDLLQLFSLVLAAPLVPELTEYFPAALEMRVAGGPLASNLMEPLGRILQLGKAAGVGAQMLWQPDEDAEMFAFPVTRGHLTGDTLSGALSFGLATDAGQFPDGGAMPSGPILISDDDASELFPGYDGYDGVTMSIDGYGMLTSDHANGTLVLFLGTGPADPGKGLGDAGDASVGGELEGAV